MKERGIIMQSDFHAALGFTYHAGNRQCPGRTGAGNDGARWGFRPIVWFAELWNSINAKRGYGWGSNPYVWVIEFKVLP